MERGGESRVLGPESRVLRGERRVPQRGVGYCPPIRSGRWPAAAMGGGKWKGMWYGRVLQEPLGALADGVHRHDRGQQRGRLLLVPVLGPAGAGRGEPGAVAGVRMHGPVQPVPVHLGTPADRAVAARGQPRGRAAGPADADDGAYAGCRPAAAGDHQAARVQHRREPGQAAPGPGCPGTSTSTSCPAGKATPTSCRSWPEPGSCRSRWRRSTATRRRRRRSLGLPRKC